MDLCIIWAWVFHHKTGFFCIPVLTAMILVRLCPLRWNWWLLSGHCYFLKTPLLLWFCLASFLLKYIGSQTCVCVHALIRQALACVKYMRNILLVNKIDINPEKKFYNLTVFKLCCVTSLITVSTDKTSDRIEPPWINAKFDLESIYWTIMIIDLLTLSLFLLRYKTGWKPVS